MWVKKLFFSVVLISGITLVVLMCGILLKARAANAWPVVKGKIVHSKVTKYRSKVRRRGTFTTLYKPDILYEYVVDNAKYSSNKFSIAQFNSSDIAIAQKIVNKYLSGSITDVYYNPAENLLYCHKIEKGVYLKSSLR